MDDLWLRLEHSAERPLAAADRHACAVRAWGCVQATPSQIDELRRRPGPVGKTPWAPNFLRPCDGQTVVGIAAVLRAIADFGLDSCSFGEWGVLAAPRFVGRLIVVSTVSKFLSQGASGISPHLIPQESLHSLSGAISVGLGIRGPNFGVGGGPRAVIEGLLMALTVLDRGDLPGVWLILTQWSPEPIPNETGASPVPTTCQAVALALAPQTADAPGWQLRLGPRVAGGSPHRWEASAMDGDPAVAGMAEFLTCSAVPTMAAGPAPRRVA